MKCEKHPKYQGKSKPRNLCVTCWAMYLNITEEEVVTGLQSMQEARVSRTERVKMSKKSFTYGFFSDAHIGHIKFHESAFDYMVEFFKKNKVDFIVNPGDHVEGMSGRPGHIYELSHTGFQQQFGKCVELYKRLDNFPHYGITGNHDQWYYKKANGGLDVGAELQAHLENYHHLGQDEGTIDVNGVKIYLYHGGDGTAYADSYKGQKLIESFSGGEKPHIVHSGH